MERKQNMKEQYKQAVQTFLNKILKKDSNKDVFNDINSNIVLIKEKYSDSCINNLIEITNIMDMINCISEQINLQ